MRAPHPPASFSFVSFVSEAIEPANKAIRLRIVSAITVIATAAISFLGLQEVAFFGFPDGHITDYERAVKPVLNVSYYSLAALALYFLSVTIFSGIRKKHPKVFTTALVMVALLFLVVTVGVPLYFGHYLALDNGVGG